MTGDHTGWWLVLLKIQTLFFLALSEKKSFLGILNEHLLFFQTFFLQNLQENTYAVVSFSYNCRSKARNFTRKNILVEVFFRTDIFKNASGRLFLLFSISPSSSDQYVMLCAIQYHLYNF